MSVLFQTFRHIQLFCFAFALAASALLFVGIASGRMDRGPVYLGMAEQFAAVLVQHPAFMAAMAGEPEPLPEGLQRAKAPDHVAPVPDVPGVIPSVGPVRSASDSLRALRARQFAELDAR